MAVEKQILLLLIASDGLSFSDTNFLKNVLFARAGVHDINRFSFFNRKS